MRVAVLGTGTWGTALAQLLCDNSHQVIMYGIEKDEVKDIKENHQNSLNILDLIFFYLQN